MRYRIWRRVNWGTGESGWVHTIGLTVLVPFVGYDEQFARLFQQSLQEGITRVTYVLVVD